MAKGKVILYRVGEKGSAKSGNYGHAGRPGKLGGSIPKHASEVSGLSEATTPELVKLFENWGGSPLTPDETLLAGKLLEDMKAAPNAAAVTRLANKWMDESTLSVGKIDLLKNYVKPMFAVPHILTSDEARARNVLQIRDSSGHVRARRMN